MRIPSPRSHRWPSLNLLALKTKQKINEDGKVNGWDERWLIEAGGR